jgi:hypothetical protein
MNRIPFNPATDRAPLPFDRELLDLARELKDRGLPWQPHVGCFVWDPDGHIEAPSPFPERVYFILSMPRFIDIFGSIEAIKRDLVWIPTWYQARQVCREKGIAIPGPVAESQKGDFFLIYTHLLDALGAA